MKRPKKVLIITYYFPPANSIAGFRWLRFVKYMPEFGWEPIVLTVKETNATPRDMDSLKELPAGLKVYRTSCLDFATLWQKLMRKKKIVLGDSESKGNISSAFKTPNRLQRLITEFVKRWILFPDAFVGWFPFVFREGIRIVRKESVDLMCSTSPHSIIASLIGLILKKMTGKTWIVEIRDVWAGGPYFTPPTPLHRWLALYLEKKIVYSADKIIFLTQSLRDFYREKYPKLKEKKIAVVYNSFDKDEYQNIPLKTKKPNCFTIVHTGILTKDRSVLPFIEAYSKLINEQNIEQGSILFKIIGPFYDYDLHKIIEERSLKQCIQIVGWLPHRKAMVELQNADLLLLVKASIDRIHIPGKFFEYIGAKKPILILAYPCEVTRIGEGTNTSLSALPDDATDIFHKLSKLYKQFKQGKLEKAFEPQSIERFESRNTTKELIGEFEKAVSFEALRSDY